MMPTLRARDPLHVACGLLANDGIRHVVEVGRRDEFTFSLAYRQWIRGDEHRGLKAVVVEWRSDPRSGYVAVHPWGGGAPIWFIVLDPDVPEGVVRETVPMPDVEATRTSVATPITYEREHTFEELGIEPRQHARRN